jgi:hypothetical protein
MKTIHRASDTIGIKGSIPYRIETLHPKKDYSMEESYLLIYLLSLPPNWNLKQSWVIFKFEGVMGRDRVKKAWTSLKLKGHLLKIKGEKFTDVNWVVYEIPLKDCEPVHLEPVDQESVKNNTNTQDTNTRETNNTRTSILGKISKTYNERPEHLKPSTSTLGTHTRNEIEETSIKLVTATSLGADIFHYDTESKINRLENLIGADEFMKAKPLLLKWIRAKNR